MADPATGPKRYSRIGEVAQLTGLKPSILRFWETEFPEIAPRKSRTGQRLYTEQDIRTITRIKELLYKEKLTIEGARKKLKQHEGSHQSPADVTPEMLHLVVGELQEIRKILEQ